MRPVLVFGHRNPDCDSICSAIAYAHLRNRTDGDQVYVPVRLGEMPPDAAWVLERFGVETPAAIEHVRLRVRDAMSDEVVTVGPDEPLLTVGRLMREHGIRSVPVAQDGHVVGIVSMETLAARYLDDLDVHGFSAKPVRVGQLVSVLEGRLLAGSADAVLSGAVHVGAMEPDTLVGRIHAGDVLIVGDRRRSQPAALEAGVACLVVTGGVEPEPAVLELAAAKGASVVLTGHATYAAMRLVDLCHAVREVMETDVVTVDPDALLAEAAEEIVSSPQRSAVVVDAEGALAGILTRTGLARARKREVVLVDHNESAQSAEGIEDASVIEIVDHHRIGDISTAGPIPFTAMPVGSTATIVASRYLDAGVQPPKAMAGLMLAALLSDTVMLKSPTTTDLDRVAAEKLAWHAGVDAAVFGMEVFRARSAGQEFSAADAVGRDLKEFHVGDATVAIAQLETVDAEAVLAHRDELFAEMEHTRLALADELVLLMVTDIVREGTELLAAGRVSLAEKALGISLADGSAWLPGVLSRKKQVAAKLLG